MKRTSYTPSDLHLLSEQLAQWRGQQVGRRRLPEEVWRAAATLARDQGLARVARVLRIDYYKLKRLAATQACSAPGQAPPVHFAELGMSVPADGSGYSVRVEDGTGRRMSVQLGNDLGAVERLVAAFWRPGV